MYKLKNIPGRFSTSYLIRNDSILKNIILSKYKRLNNFYESIKNQNQIGGSRQIKTIYNNEIFIWNENEPNWWSLNDKFDNDCVSITFAPERKESNINNINADTIKCGNTILNNQGSHLFKIALQFIKENKIKFNINKIFIKDNANKYCKNNVNIHLGIFLTLLTGHTWYGKYGFRPINTHYRLQYRQNRYIMYKVKLSDINFNIILKKIFEYKNNNSISLEQYDYFMKVYNKLKIINPLVKNLLYVIFRKDKYEFMCSVFDLIQDDLINLLNIKITHLTGNTYELEI